MSKPKPSEDICKSLEDRLKEDFPNIENYVNYKSDGKYWIATVSFEGGTELTYRYNPKDDYWGNCTSPYNS